jgi:hypothetical protein
MNCPDCGKEMSTSFICGNCGTTRKEKAMPEPTSEDDCPDNEVLSTSPFQFGEKTRTINYIREEGEDFFKPLNVQIDDAEAHNGRQGRPHS